MLQHSVLVAVCAGWPPRANRPDDTTRTSSDRAASGTANPMIMLKLSVAGSAPPTLATGQENTTRDYGHSNYNTKKPPRRQPPLDLLPAVCPTEAAGSARVGKWGGEPTRRLIAVASGRGQRPTGPSPLGQVICRVGRGQRPTDPSHWPGDRLRVTALKRDLLN